MLICFYLQNSLMSKAAEINPDFVVEQTISSIRFQRGYAVIRYNDLRARLPVKRIQLLQLNEVRNKLARRLRQLGFKYAIVMSTVNSRVKHCNYHTKIYLFYSLDHELARALLERRSCRAVYEITETDFVLLDKTKICTLN